MAANPLRLELITFFIAMIVICQVSVATATFAAASQVGTIRVGNSTTLPHAIVYNPANKMMYVDTDNGVAVINSLKNKVVHEIDVKGSTGVVYDPINKMTYSLNYVPGTGSVVSIIDPSTNHLVRNIPLPNAKIFSTSVIHN
jgi:DNA-binding beta-propeller fold protein YncE